jgi:sulfonate transport system permease protein
MKRALRGVVLPLLIMTVWEFASRLGLVDARILPPPENVAATALREVMHGGQLFDLAASLARDIAGFLGGTVLGLAIGIVVGVSPLAERLVLPTFNGLRQIAILAWIPLIALWFGFGDGAKSFSSCCRPSCLWC